MAAGQAPRLQACPLLLLHRPICSWPLPLQRAVPPPHRSPCQAAQTAAPGAPAQRQAIRLLALLRRPLTALHLETQMGCTLQHATA